MSIRTYILTPKQIASLHAEPICRGCGVKLVSGDRVASKRSGSNRVLYCETCARKILLIDMGENQVV